VAVRGSNPQRCGPQRHSNCRAAFEGLAPSKVNNQLYWPRCNRVSLIAGQPHRVVAVVVGSGWVPISEWDFDTDLHFANLSCAYFSSGEYNGSGRIPQGCGIGGAARCKSRRTSKSQTLSRHIRQGVVKGQARQ
jgi:hypothetical protein